MNAVLFPRHLALAPLVCALAATVVVFVPPVANGHARSVIAVAESMVLTSREVGSGFVERSEPFTPSNVASQGTWTLAQLEAWGYQGGFERTFNRDLYTVNGVQIASDAGVYATARGATESLISNGNACTVGAWQLLPTPKRFGHQAVFCTRTGTRDGFRGRLFFLVWRVGRFKGSISLSGVIGHVTAVEAVALARRQAARM